LGAKIGIEKSAMVIFLDQLEAKGWIQRKANPNDRRAHAIALTRDGRVRLSIPGPKLQRLEQEFFHEQNHLRAYLFKMVSSKSQNDAD
jgi:DNA-binding MarR family transcriptional regulator